jgi:predicted RNA-binding protein with PUA-like domain
VLYKCFFGASPNVSVSKRSDMGNTNNKKKRGAHASDAHNAWLMKSEPEVYSIDDLQRDAHTSWEGVRNYQARNFMRDDMAVGDWVLFYHSNAAPPGVTGIAGVARVCREAYPDHAQFDSRSPYHDPASTPESPRWYMVDIEFVEKFARVVSLAELRDRTELQGMPLLQRGQRLSVQPVSPEHVQVVLRLAGARTRV